MCYDVLEFLLQSENDVDPQNWPIYAQSVGQRLLNNGSTAVITQRIENLGFQIHNGTIVTYMNSGERVYVQRNTGRVALVGQTLNQYISFFGYSIG